MRYVPVPKSLSKQVNCTFSPNNAPILKVTPGETLQVETYDAFGYVNEPDFDLAKKLEAGEPLFDNPTTGPIYVEGAEPGDALSVRILDIKVREYGVTTITSGIGAFDDWLTRTPTITKISQIRDGKIFFPTESGKAISFPLKPFIGVIGVAPPLESISTETPYKHGGNMDIADICPGNTLFLPISVDGALLSLGDVHASQGDGEICGTAVEVSATVTIQVGLVKRKMIQWPRIESDDELMVACSARPLEDATRLAYRELIRWLEDYDISTHDGYMLLSLVAKARIAQIVDPLYTVVAKIPKQCIR